MTKLQLEKMILDETKGLPADSLKQILEYIRSIKHEKYHRTSKESDRLIRNELSELSAASLTHLEEEFTGYQELYPRE